MMDRYPEVSVNERECPREDWSSSRHDSVSSVSNVIVEQTNGAHIDDKTNNDNEYTSFPPPSLPPNQRADSSSSTESGRELSRRLDAEFARYTHAPPPHSPIEYQGKTADEQTSMRMKDYAKELSRAMGRQLVED